jgi:hypothetical protein
MTVGPDIPGLSDAQKDALIGSLMAQGAALVARAAELEATLGLPPKTPDNSSLPPSKGQKPSAPAAAKAKANPHAGVHRPLHPDPTSKRDFRALRCQGCGADVSGVAQSFCESYDRVEIPEIEPDVTGVALHGGVCPCCAKRFKAERFFNIVPRSKACSEFRFPIPHRVQRKNALNRAEGARFRPSISLRPSQPAIVRSPFAAPGRVRSDVSDGQTPRLPYRHPLVLTRRGTDCGVESPSASKNVSMTTPYQRVMVVIIGTSPSSGSFADHLR